VELLLVDHALLANEEVLLGAIGESADQVVEREGPLTGSLHVDGALLEEVYGLLWAVDALFGLAVSHLGTLPPPTGSLLFLLVFPVILQW
jgi:hypothetical protein